MGVFYIGIHLTNMFWGISYIFCVINQCFSNCNEHVYVLGVLLKWRLWISRSEKGPRLHISNNLPAFVDTYRAHLLLAQFVLPDKKLIGLVIPHSLFSAFSKMWYNLDRIRFACSIFPKNIFFSSGYVLSFSDTNSIVITTAVIHRYFPSFLISRIFSCSGMFLVPECSGGSQKVVLGSRVAETSRNSARDKGSYLHHPLSDSDHMKPVNLSRPLVSQLWKMSCPFYLLFNIILGLERELERERETEREHFV